MLRPAKIAVQSSIDARALASLTKRAADMHVAEHMSQHSTFDTRKHVAGGDDMVRCRNHGSFRAEGLSNTQRAALSAVHDAIKACDAVQVPVVLWSHLHVDWMQDCTIAKERKTHRLFVPYDAMVSMEHLGLLYVCALL